MNILLISLFESPSEKGSNSRLSNILNSIGSANNVMVVTSDFNHGRKARRGVMPSRVNGKSIIYLPVPEYKKNLSIARIYSHCCFARLLKKFLNSLQVKPDMVYCAMPASSPALAAGKYCERNKIPFVVDVIDLWPNSLIPLSPIKKLMEGLVYPWKQISVKAYSKASYISAESKEYMKEAQRYNPNVPASYTYLGVDIDRTRNLIESAVVEIPSKPKDEIWLCYGGSLGNSYDFDSILKAIRAIDRAGFKYKMWFVGGGEKENEIRTYAHKHELNVEITGRIAYNNYLKYLNLCDIAFNSFLPDTLVVHSYKFNDYVACGCYIINSLKGETAELLEESGIGITFTPSTIESQIVEVCNKIDEIKAVLPERIEYVIKEYLNISTIYPRLIDSISESLALDIK